jgi:hypothetical protein
VLNPNLQCLTKKKSFLTELFPAPSFLSQMKHRQAFLSTEKKEILVSHRNTSEQTIRLSANAFCVISTLFTTRKNENLSNNL